MNKKSTTHLDEFINKYNNQLSFNIAFVLKTSLIKLYTIFFNRKAHIMLIILDHSILTYNKIESYNSFRFNCIFYLKCIDVKAISGKS
jgi:hypothetical protein